MAAAMTSERVDIELLLLLRGLHSRRSHAGSHLNAESSFVEGIAGEKPLFSGPREAARQVHAPAVMDQRLRALNGFGLGARVGEAARLRDPKAWLRAQLEGGAPIVLPPADASPTQIAEALRAFRTVGQISEPERRQARQQARRRLIEIAAAESRAALAERVTSSRPFVERLVAFWSNHLCVSTAAKVIVAPLAGSYEREAIRPHVLGRFDEMVLASAKHSAMLVYLDNFQSIGPGSRGARMAARGRGGRGLNENYARELLELHTLGVDGGYTQQDVQELARTLTGWTIQGPVQMGGRRRMDRQMDAARSIGFAFQEALHEPGSKTVLGVEYRQAGVAEGERAIRALCREPATSRFVATKLVRHFVSDESPATAVDRIARVFRASDGDLRAVSAALIELPEAWDSRARKFRTPQDWLVAALRAFGAGDVPEQALALLRQLRHPLWSPQAPKGFGDTTQEWADPDALLNRAELSRTIARRLRGVDPRTLLDVVDVATGDPLHELLATSSIAADERIALVLAGPAFQWR
jgi:uncharacterized protein (DUF1800 family)